MALLFSLSIYIWLDVSSTAAPGCGVRSTRRHHACTSRQNPEANNQDASHVEQQCMHIHVCHPWGDSPSADRATPPLAPDKAKSIFNLQSIIFYDIPCIWISTYTYHYFMNLIAFIIVWCCPILVVRISSGVISNPTSCCSSAAGSRGHLIWIS